VLIEDAAQGLGATYRGRAVGSFGLFGALSFHETKNVTCGEGGALLLRDPELVETVEVMQEKGTDRARLFRGETDRYTWRDTGSSYLLSEINAAFLWAQLEAVDEIQAARTAIWQTYHDSFAALEAEGLLRRPVVPPDRTHNAHMYYLLMPDEEGRDNLIAYLRTRGVVALFHYVPLHSSPAGRRLGRAHGAMLVTDDVSARLLRLPLWVGMDEETVATVVTAVRDGVTRATRRLHAGA
jgi:dTDP-4-amino-4,6-dideoxygalactose transaminase